MGLFLEDKKVEYSPWYTEGANYLQNLLRSGTPTVPQQGVAELTPMQEVIQGGLPDLYGRTGEYAQRAADYYGDILNTPYSLENDPYAELLQRQEDIAGGKAITASRRGMESRGMLDSSHTAWNDISSYMNAINPYAQERASLVREQAARKERAAEGIQGVAGREVANVAAVGSIADQQRMIEQAQQDALYQQLLMQILFPYQYQAGLAQSLTGQPGGVEVKGGGLTDLGFYMQMMSSAAGKAAMAP